MFEFIKSVILPFQISKFITQGKSTLSAFPKLRLREPQPPSSEFRKQVQEQAQLQKQIQEFPKLLKSVFQNFKIKLT